MVRLWLSFLCWGLACAPLHGQYETDTVSQALRQGKYLESRKKYDLALESYRWADKQAHHSSPICYLHIAAVERKMGRLSDALEDAKRAEKVAGNDKASAVQAHLLRAGVLVQMAGKPTDKKLKMAEEELQEALALDPELAYVHYALGMILLKEGNDAGGVAELKLYLASPRAARDTLEEVQRIIANPIRAREPFAPDFSFVTLENQRVSNSVLRGKVVLLDFWGTWCEPCRESVPMLRNLQKEFAGPGFQLVGISSDNDDGVVRTFVEAQHMDWQEHVDVSGEISTVFKVESVPTFVVLDKDGVIRFRQSGWNPSSQADLEEVISKAQKRALDPALASAYAVNPPAAASEPAHPGDASSGATPEDAAPLPPAELGRVEGGLYTNAALGISYQLPAGWIALSPENLHQTNLRIGSKLRNFARIHPELPGDVEAYIAQYALYASRQGEGDGQRIAVPCLRFSITPSKDPDLKLEEFEHFAESMSAIPGIRLRREAAEFTVKEHRFVRADFDRSSEKSHAFEALVRTLVGGKYLLEIEIFTGTAMELQKIVDTLQTMSFNESAH